MSQVDRCPHFSHPSLLQVGQVHVDRHALPVLFGMQPWDLQVAHCRDVVHEEQPNFVQPSHRRQLAHSSVVPHQHTRIAPDPRHTDSPHFEQVPAFSLQTGDL
eukprot:TRINITY_DN30787_c0_g1_i1.p2 TRINITY_DN30787_c0_g1~~TRINITY_DN30787_c0_g1_i1.p2  ORF type:complete len:103 (-),score=0.20 TRINITY_DN30787_c0_g1_i1:313-621(-)